MGKKGSILLRLSISCCQLIVLIHVTLDSHAQIKNIGLPFIINHSRNEYNASTQNWSITQSKSGFMYFGNNDGILEYDGTNWRTFPVPNSSIVRSVLAVGDTIYAGAFEEIGFLAYDQDGKLAYHSLNHLIPDAYKNFDEIWNIYERDGSVFFQSFNYIFILFQGAMRVIEPLSRFSMLYLVKDDFFVVDELTGLMKLEGDKLELISDHPIFFRNEIRCILPLESGNLFVGTSNEGVFLYDQSRNSIFPFEEEINSQIRDEKLFSAVKSPSGHIAIGTVRNGIYISNENGQIMQHLNRYKGLQNNTVLSLFMDRRNNLWLGLDNGIDYLEVSSPLSVLNYNYHIESAYASIVHDGILYVGTNQGLYAKPVSEVPNFSSPSEGFSLVRGTEGQVWSLDVIDNTLFCGHNFGCFIITGLSAQQISDRRGFWSFFQPSDRENLIIAGSYTGLVSLKKEQNQWELGDEITGFEESSRNLFIDRNKNVWISHGYRGLIRLTLNEDYDSVRHVELYSGSSGLPEELPYNIQVIDAKMYVSTNQGLYEYDPAGNRFYLSKELNKIFENKGFIDKIHQDSKGNLWYYTENYLGLMRLVEDASFVDIIFPFAGIGQILLPAFQNIFIQDSDNVFVGSQKGLIHYSPGMMRDYLLAEDVYIREASFYGKQHDMVSFHLEKTLENILDKTRVIPYSMNSVMFRFTAPFYESPQRIQFSYRLHGFDSNWSEWDGVNFKEYTNLREGSYTFQVKALNSFGSVSNIRNFSFTIKPPFFRSSLAYAGLSFLLLIIIIGNIYYIRKRILAARLREKLQHEKRLAQREKMFQEQTALSEKEIVQLRNESLRKEMIYKNKELANATLHLIQKNKTLTYLKEDLSKLLKTIPSNNLEKQNVNDLLKKINRDLRNEKNWELFNNYFDEVHQDFITRLKAKYENLTPKELRLCAYLRMNISSKEIAPLMNISVRGVEISRYRLRKKLRLDHDTNLTDFIMSF
jgi:DNA-binding CsgD family transcriptional regulator